MPASLSDDKIIKHMARRTLKLFVKNETPPNLPPTRPGEKQASLPCQTTHTRQPPKRQTSLNVIKP
ncbi:hypothetical protein ACNKHV_09660 [Shigella flexneri]